MSRLDELIKEHCPNGVEYVPLWSVTIWDKKFNSVDRNKQLEVINYTYLLASDLFALEQDGGNVFLLSTGEQTGWTTEEMAGENIHEGEVVTIPWGKSRAVTDCIKYYKGKFVTADNRIMTSNNTEKLSNKFLYYYIMSQGKVIDTFYRGSGIKHPDMAKVLDLVIPLPPIEVQREIVKILDNFTLLTAELTAELTARRKQYEYYRDKLLSFDVHGGGTDEVEWRTLEKLCYNISSGKNKEKETYGAYPVYGSTGIIAYCNKPVYNSKKILLARVGANAGYVQIADGEYDVSDNTLIVSPTDTINYKYLYYQLKKMNLRQFAKGGGQPLITAGQIKKICIPVPSKTVQEKIVSVLDNFDAICSDLSIGLPAEIEARQKQYEYYRDKLLSFKEL